MTAIVLHDDGSWVPDGVSTEGMVTLRRNGYDDKWVELDFERHILEWNDQIILGPSMNHMSSWMNSRELLHLELFLMCRNTISLDDTSARFSGIKCIDFPDLNLSTELSMGEQFTSYVGNPSPRVLLLGDIHNVMDGYPYKASFGGWGGCGTFLLDSLPREIWLEFGMANSNEEDLPELTRALGYPQVVALGRNSQRACVDSGLSCGVVPHPQWTKRFAHRKLTEYGSLIQRVAVSGNDEGSWRERG